MRWRTYKIECDHVHHICAHRKKKQRIRKNEWKKRWKRKCPKMWHTQTTHSYGCRCANDSLNNERKTINDLWLHGHISTLYTCERFWQHLTCSMYNQLKNMYTRTYSPSERNVVWRWHRQQHKSDDVKMKGNDGKLKKKKEYERFKILTHFFCIRCGKTTYIDRDLYFNFNR